MKAIDSIDARDQLTTTLDRLVGLTVFVSCCGDDGQPWIDELNPTLAAFVLDLVADLAVKAKDLTQIVLEDGEPRGKR
jgi:hypothetical protein